MIGVQTGVPLPSGYEELLETLKARIRSAQVRAALSVNRELVLLYWQIGKEILERQRREGWGSKVIDRLANDLKREFPEMRGLSRANLFYMRAFAEAWPDRSIVQQVVGQIPWGHQCVLLSKVKDPNERLWYVRQTLQHGWSRNVLVHQIESRLFQRQGQAVTNFDSTLPAPQSDLVRDLIKDPYVFDFLTVGSEAQERDLQRGLLEHLRDFLLELGKGFAFVGSQYRLEVGGEDFYIDLLFYQIRLRCYVVVDLKIGKFKPEYAGKMSFYLSAVDEMLRQPGDRPSVGLILCREKNRVVTEYTLRDLNKPMGVATYRISEALPADLRKNLPTPEQLEAELRRASSRL
ncbi:MAG: DUF1016 domain-containing protein [Calditrichaeota bacterium]|nr:DUF1016 domain-containing protein [Calditrichota bacterium]